MLNEAFSLPCRGILRAAGSGQQTCGREEVGLGPAEPWPRGFPRARGRLIATRQRPMAIAAMDMLSPTLRASDGPLPAYRRLVAEGELAADPAQQLAAERLQDLWIKLRGYDPPPLAPQRRASCRGCCAASRPRRRRGPAERPLSRRRGRPRQIHADGPVLRRRRGVAQAAHPFPPLHAGRPRPHPCLEAGQSGRRRPDPAAGRRDRGRGGAAVLRRVPGQRHRRRDDPRPAVPGAVRARRGGGRDLQHRARRSVQGPARAATPSCRSSR